MRLARRGREAFRHVERSADPQSETQRSVGGWWDGVLPWRLDACLAAAVDGEQEEVGLLPE